MSTETNSDKSMVNEPTTANTKRPFGIRVVAVLMIIFGIAEVGTGVTHNFLGMVSTTETNLSMYIGAALGLCYFIGGISLSS